ncbi:MXAN_6230/SCO0854 family RING domain-containing protein [Kitasatospora sp. NPDC001540]|uniref:MXAN_6230/SCO0854 family RING domain-containing protein n=1 Tax=Kitasatospora sp. NPDC001540 TaxID=3364014 RepID=UPI00368EF321
MPRAVPVKFDVRVDRDLGSFLLRRRTAVAVDPAELLPAADPWSLRGLTALDADLAARGYLPTVELRSALARLAPLRLAALGGALLGRLDHLLGTDREHTPLFRRFPDAVPEVAQLHHSRRMRAFLRSQPYQPCARCGRRGAEVGIGLLAPCAHLLCPDCLEAQDGPPRCPSCGVVLAAQPFLYGGKRKAVREQAPPRKGQPDRAERPGAVLRPLRLLEQDELSAAMDELTALLTRRTALGPQDRDDLATLLAHAPADLAARLPAEIPVRETKAVALAELLRREGESALPVLAERLTTATDVLRLLWAYAGAQPDLLPGTARRLRLRGLSRPLRRGLLGALEALPAAALAEDLRRHREPWLRVGESLHPFEYRRQFPSTAAAFALLRGTDLDGFGPGFAEPPAPLRVERVDGRRRLAHTGFASRVETLLAVGDTSGALTELARRPGELVRRLHHLLRVHEIMEPGTPPPAELSAALARALPAVGPGPLLGAYGRLRGPRSRGERRLYFPRGLVSSAYGREDHGTVVPARSSAPVVAAIEAELLRRSAATLPVRPEVALLDEALTGMSVPFAERSAARALVSVPRGSRLPLPPGERLRLFLHWMQPQHQRVDLDLSVALYDDGWRHRGTCDYTQLVFGRRAAVHSGDYTSAPPPLGASEFVDLDFAALRATGLRYAVMVVFSYNDVPFDRLPEAFTGFAAVDGDGGGGGGGGGPLSARAVRQRMDLTGNAKVSVPLIVDLAERRFTWTDLNTAVPSGFHSVARHRDTIAALCGDVLDHFAPDRRATLWDVACARAAHATGEVLVRGLDGAVLRWRRQPAEPLGEFAERLRLRHAPDGPPATEPLPELLSGRRAFLALLDADLPVPPGVHGELYRLHPGPLDAAPDALRRLTAADLVATLAPTPR